MCKGEDCGCGRHHEEQHESRHEHRGTDCGCGRHSEGHHSGGCRCGCHHHEGVGFRRHFIPREEVIARLEEYLKQLQAESKGVEERITELKGKGESQTD